MIPQSTIEDILNAAQIEEVVGEFVSLKKRGSNYVALCPFHNEKTPSFNVSPSKEIYKCFGCGKAGDVVKFLMEHEHLSYPEALRWLAERYNITIEEDEDDAEAAAKRDKRESLLILNNFAAKYYQEQLFESEEGKNIGLSYFKERNFREATIKKFHLGYAPKKGDALSQTALEKGYQRELLKELGLSKEKDSRLYDFFRERVVFPIHNLTGKVIAFGARTLSSDKKTPKYLNSPESEVYHKSKVLYGAFQSKNAIRQQDLCYMVEGYTDVISLHQGGIENVVASSGTSLTQDQVRLVKRYTENLTILYDGDQAGIAAAMRGLEIVLKEGMNVKLVVLPDGEDPDSFLQSEGTATFKEFIQRNAKDFIFFKTELLKKETGNDPAKKTELIRNIVDTVALIPDPIKRSLYIKECSAKLDVREQLLVNEVNKVIGKKLRDRRRKQESQERREEVEKEDMERLIHEQERVPQAEKKESSYYQERDAIRVLLEFAGEVFEKDEEEEEEVTVAEFVVNELDDYEFESKVFQQIFDIYLEAVEVGEVPSLAALKHHEDEEVQQAVIELLSLHHDVSENWSRMHEIQIEDKSVIYRQDVKSSVCRVLLKKVKKEIDKNRQQLDKERESEDVRNLLLVRQKLKEMEITLTKQLNTVIY